MIQPTHNPGFASPPGITDLIAQPKKKEYRTDLGSLVALITIIGDTEPGPEDFEALKDFAELQKKQAQRKLGLKSDPAKGPLAGEKL